MYSHSIATTDWISIKTASKKYGVKESYIQSLITFNGLPIVNKKIRGVGSVHVCERTLEQSIDQDLGWNYRKNRELEKQIRLEKGVISRKQKELEEHRMRLSTLEFQLKNGERGLF